MATPITTGAAVTVTATSSSGTTAVTCPADAELILAFWSHWTDNALDTLGTLTYDGASFLPAEVELPEGQTFNAPGVGAAVLVNPSTGSNQLAWAWNGNFPRVEGGGIVLVFYKDVDTANPVFDSNAAHASTGGAVSTNLTNVIPDHQVVGFGERFGGSGVNLTIDGATPDTVITTGGVNSHFFEVGESTGVSGTIAVAVGNPSYSCAAAVALAGADVVARFWVAGTTGNWSDTANWSESSGGPGGAAVPLIDDSVTFDGNGLGSVNVDIDADILSLSIDDAYTGEFIFPAGSPRKIQTVGNCSVGLAATVSLNNIASQLLVGGNFVNNGTITSPGHVKFVNTAADTTFLVSGSGVTGRLELESSATGQTVQLSSNHQVGELASVQNTPFTFAPNNFDLRITGDVALTNDLTWSKGTGSVILADSQDQLINFNNVAIESLSYEKSAGTVTISASFQMDAFDWQAGAAGTADFNNQDVTVIGNFTAAAGATFTEPV